MFLAIVQARMGAERLPGKVLMDVEGKPLLRYQIDRIMRSKMIDRIVVATSTRDSDDAIVAFCEKNGVECFRGPEEDVLTRFYDCARAFNGKAIVRLTGDCPLLDPEVIDETIHLYNDMRVDFAANTVPPETSTYPDGSDVEVFSMEALTRAYQETTDKTLREHVTFYFWQADNGFETAQLRGEEDWSRYRFTVDYPEDFEVVSFIIQELKQRRSFGHIDEIIQIIDSNPEIKKRNSAYYFGIGWEKQSREA